MQREKLKSVAATRGNETVLCVGADDLPTVYTSTTASTATEAECTPHNGAYVIVSQPGAVSLFGGVRGVWGGGESAQDPALWVVQVGDRCQGWRLGHAPFALSVDLQALLPDLPTPTHQPTIHPPTLACNLPTSQTTSPILLLPSYPLLSSQLYPFPTSSTPALLPTTAPALTLTLTRAGVRLVPRN